MASFVKDRISRDKIIDSTLIDFELIQGAERIISMARGEVGTVDNRLVFDNNHRHGIANVNGRVFNKYGLWFNNNDSTPSLHQNTSWCGMFVSWVFDKSGIPLGTAQIYVIRPGDTVLHQHAHGYAGVRSAREFWERDRSLPFDSSNLDKEDIPNKNILIPLPGDIVLYMKNKTHVHHTGIFVRFETFPNADSDFFFALEGNTHGPNLDGQPGITEQDGGEVALKKRSISADGAIFVHPQFKSELLEVDSNSGRVLHFDHGLADFKDSNQRPCKTDRQGNLYEVDQSNNVVIRSNRKVRIGNANLNIVQKIKKVGDVYPAPAPLYGMDFDNKGNAITKASYKKFQNRIITKKKKAKTGVKPNSVVLYCPIKQGNKKEYHEDPVCKMTASSITKNARVLKTNAKSKSCQVSVFQISSGYNKKFSNLSYNLDGLSTCADHQDKVSELVLPSEVDESTPVISSFPFTFKAYSNSNFCFFPLAPEKFVYEINSNTHNAGTETKIEVFPDTKVKIKLTSTEKGSRLNRIDVTGSFEEDDNRLTDYTMWFKHDAFFFYEANPSDKIHGMKIKQGVQKIKLISESDDVSTVHDTLIYKIKNVIVNSIYNIFSLCDVVPFMQNIVNKICAESPAILIPIHWPQITMEGNWGWSERNNDPKCLCEFVCKIELKINPLINIGAFQHKTIIDEFGEYNISFEGEMAKEFNFKLDFKATEEEMRNGDILKDNSEQTKMEISINLKNSAGVNKASTVDQTDDDMAKFIFSVYNFRCESNSIKVDYEYKFTGLKIKDIKRGARREVTEVLCRAKSLVKTIQLFNT